MRSVNLLPSDDSSQGRKLPLPALVACVGVVVMTAALAVMFLSASAKVGKEQRALQDVQATYDALPAPAAASPLESSLPAQQTTRVSALAAALGQRVVWDRLLREVSQVVPSDVWLLSLNAQAPTAASVAAAAVPGAAPSQTFNITGCTYSQDSVARFLARLDIVPDLTDMTLGKAQSGADGGGGGTTVTGCPSTMITFALQGSVRPSGATS